MATVREFVTDAYQLVTANNPTVPLHGDDLEKGIRYLNELLEYYASTGLLLTIAKTGTCPLIVGQQEVVCGPPGFLPVPDITLGRLANLDSAWLVLDGVSYPLIDKSRDEFLASFKYEPLQGLPRFVIVYPDTDVTRIRLFPAPSQFFQFYVRGKFQLNRVNSIPDILGNVSDTMDGLPAYYMRFLKLALAKDISVFKARTEAWTDKLEAMLVEAQQKMEAASEVNLTITGDRASLLNGAWRVRAGV